jgi:hypothetical protein
VPNPSEASRGMTVMEQSTNIKGKKLEGILHDDIVNWKLVAEPQADQYDSLVVLEFTHQGGRASKTGNRNNRSTFFDGMVAFCDQTISSFPSHLIPAPLDHPNIEKACNLIRLWPTVFTQFQLLTESVSPFINTKYFFNTSYSTDGGGFGKIAATIDDPVDFAGALVHEMAHHKLRALGVEVESAERIIKNPPEQQFKSPIRYDRLRPMSGVFHAQYSFTYVCALEIKIIGSCQEVEIVDRSLANLVKLLPKLEFGNQIIKDNVEVDLAGSQFMKGFFAWFNRILEDSYKILDEFQLSPKIFIHPLDDFNIHQDSREILKLIQAKPQQVKNIENVSLGDDMLIYLPEQDKEISLNSSAKMIWELCNGEYTVVEISQKLSQRLGFFDNELLQSEILKNVIEAVVRLCQAEIVTLEEIPCAKSI